MRLVAFSALAAFATAHWGTARGGRAGRPDAARAAGGDGRRRRARAARPRAAAARRDARARRASSASRCWPLGLMAAGLPGRLLLPAHWGELVRRHRPRPGRGARASNGRTAAPSEWIRLTVLLGAPALLTIAALLAFWPARRAAPVLRVARPGDAAPALRHRRSRSRTPGSRCCAGWCCSCWSARGCGCRACRAARRSSAGRCRGERRRAVAPVAAALDGDRAWWDYRAWDWFGDGKVITFDWNHSYGPLDWSRAGATVLNVKSDRPHYWKAETLDGFDGLRWVRCRDARRGALRPGGRLHGGR